MKDELHQVQASILKELLFHNGTNFSSLNKLGLTNDHFTFHLKRLMEEGVVEKNGKKYSLTQAGKTYAHMLDVDALVMEKQGTCTVAVTAKKVIDGKVHYLVQQRLKEPLYGYFGFINGKIRFGEFSVDTAQRELEEETGLTGKPTVLCVAHKIRGPRRSEIKLDHFFFLYLVKKPIGKLKDTKEGKNYWMTLDKIKKLKTLPGFKSYLDAVEKETFTPYFEHFIKVDNI